MIEIESIYRKAKNETKMKREEIRRKKFLEVGPQYIMLLLIQSQQKSKYVCVLCIFNEKARDFMNTTDTMSSSPFT